MDKIKTAWDWFRANMRVLVFLGLVLFANVGIEAVFGWRHYISFGGGFMIYQVLTHFRSLINTRFIDWINPMKWGSVLYASFMKMLFPMHIVEQLILRMYDNECRKCMVNGSCLHCGCDMSKVYTPWDACSRGFWGPTIESEKEYREMRKEWPVEISITYPKEAKNTPVKHKGTPFDPYPRSPDPN